MIRGHGGNIYELAEKIGCHPDEIVDMSSNVNPIGPMPGIMRHLKKTLDDIKRLPEVDSWKMNHAFASCYGKDAREVLAGNGSTQFIYLIPRVLKSKKVLVLGPTYSDYADSCIMNNVDYRHLIADESNEFCHDMERLKVEAAACDTVFICNPNNPTGSLIRAEKIAWLCRSITDTCFVVDESYLPFLRNAEQESMLRFNFSNLIVLNSMSKIYRIPGLRVGFMVSSQKLISQFEPYMLPWSVNSLAQTAVQYLMQEREEVVSFIEETRRFVLAEKELMIRQLKCIPGVKVFPSTTSFLLVRLSEKITSDSICSALAEKRFLIRNCANFNGLSNRYIRISLQSREKNIMVAEMIKELCGLTGRKGCSRPEPVE